MPAAPRLTPEQSEALQKKVVAAAEGSVAGIGWLVVTLQRIELKIALLVGAVSLMGAGMGVFSVGLLFSGEFMAALLTAFIAVVLVGLSLFLLRQQSLALDVLDEEIESRRVS